ncbi:MAG: NADPH-dependent reductase [Myxococcales bacterium]|nr:NADPH-dependent reductase [Myxococcales bacterium]
MFKLHVIIVSTRPGRVGLPIATWFHGHAQRHAKFEVALVDLAAVNLPMFDEPLHPRLGQYEHAHTKAWSETVAAADAFVIVTPEYNYATPPSLLNAIDYLHKEWAYKPVGFVSYGGPAGGARSVAMTKQVTTALKMMPMIETVMISMFPQFMVDGAFKQTETHEKAATVMLDELLRWTEAMKSLRS